VLEAVKWTYLIPLIWLAGLGSGWAELERRYLVVGAQGKSTLNNASGNFDVKLLKALVDGDKLDVPNGSSLTLTSLGDGQRYQVSGPFAYKVSAAAPSGAKVKLLTEAHDREGIRVSHKVDMSKYGGFTSRSVQTGVGWQPVFVNFDSNEPLVLDLGLTKHVMNSAGIVHYTVAKTPYKWNQTSGMVKDRKLTLPGLQIQPATTYLVDIEDGPPDDSRCAFAVARLPNNLVNTVKSQQAKVIDPASLFELYECLRNLRLYWRARQVKDQIKSKYPDTSGQIEHDFKELWTNVDE
jgi:hypothetical protein